MKLFLYVYKSLPDENKSTPSQCTDTTKDAKHNAELDNTPPNKITGRAPYFCAANTTRGAEKLNTKQKLFALMTFMSLV